MHISLYFNQSFIKKEDLMQLSIHSKDYNKLQIFHWDVKSCNILVMEDQTPKLAILAIQKCRRDVKYMCCYVPSLCGSWMLQQTELLSVWCFFHLALLCTRYLRILLCLVFFSKLRKRGGFLMMRMNNSFIYRDGNNRPTFNVEFWPIYTSCNGRRH